MIPAKVLHLQALLGKEEATYGTALTLTASVDGLQMQFAADDTAVVFTPKYVSDGDVGPSISSLGTISRVSPTGLYYDGTIPALMRLPASAYSATVLPGLHRLIKMAGFDAAVTTSAGTEKWVYTPTNGAVQATSLTLQGYQRGETIILPGAIGNLQIAAKNGKPPIFSFPTSAIGAFPSDAAALPAGLVYPNQAVPPLTNTSVTMVFGSFSANGVLKSWDFDFGRKYSNARMNFALANPHAGFIPSARVPVLKLVLEATALVGAPYHSSVGFDPYHLWDAATELGLVSIKVGGTQYNRYTVAFNQAQVTNIVPQGEGPTATVEITVTPHCSSPVANDDVTITCD